MNETELRLPKGFLQTESYPVTYRAANEILGYCVTCVNRPKCGPNHSLRMAMGNNYPFWSTDFIGVLIKDDNSFIPSTRVFCKNYKNPQPILAGIFPSDFCDGITRLVDILDIKNQSNPNLE
jgi:hypothetical protein